MLGTFRSLSAAAAAGSFALYVPWGIFQQYMLNGYFLKRLETALPPVPSGLIASVLFCGAHLPNWFLMAVTFAAAQIAIRIYRRYRNLYFLGLAHAVIGFLTFVAVPDSISPPPASRSRLVPAGAGNHDPGQTHARIGVGFAAFGFA